MGCACRKENRNAVRPLGEPVCATVPGEGWAAMPLAASRTVERQGLLIKCAIEMVSELDPDKVPQMLVDAAFAILGCDRVCLWLRASEEEQRGSGSLTADPAPRRLVRSATRQHADGGSNKQTPFELEIERGRGPAGHCWSIGATLNIPDARSHPVCECYKDVKNEAKSILCFPLRGVNNNIFGVLQAVNKRGVAPEQKGHVQFDSTDETMMNLLLSQASRQIKDGYIARLKARRARTKYDSLLKILKTLLTVKGQEELQSLVRELLINSQLIFECERCSLFAVDSLRNELVGYQISDKRSEGAADGAKGSDCELIEEHRKPIEGLVGHVVTTGETVNVPDASKDDRHVFSTIDIANGFRTRNMLVAPLTTTNGRVVAVLRCVNKKGDQSFSPHDEEELQAISLFASDVLQRILLESNFAHFFGACSDVDSDVQDVVREYNQTHADSYDRTPSARVDSGAVNFDVMNKIEQMQQWDFDHWSVIKDDGKLGTSYVTACLSHCDLATYFGVSLQDLEKVVNALQRRYSLNAPYHNWQHAFSTFQKVFVMMTSEVMNSLLPRLDTLALLLAAIGHDVEHQGVNNNFLVNKRDDMALRYNDIGVLENHHASVTCGILEEFLRDNFNASTATNFRKVVVGTILMTDMAKHSEALHWLETTKAQIPDVQSTDIHLDADTAIKFGGVILHCADLAHPTLPWLMHKRLSLLCTQEFFAQYQEEEKLGLPALPFMGKDPKDMRGLAPTQVGFIKFVCVPLWTSVCRLTVGDKVLSKPIEALQRNVDAWQCIADDGEVDDDGVAKPAPTPSAPYQSTGSAASARQLAPDCTVRSPSKSKTRDPSKNSSGIARAVS